MMVGDAKRSPWLTTASQMSAARSGGRAAGSTLWDIGGWIGGYWRVADLWGYWVGSSFLEAGSRSENCENQACQECRTDRRLVSLSKNKHQNGVVFKIS